VSLILGQPLWGCANRCVHNISATAVVWVGVGKVWWHHSCCVRGISACARGCVRGCVRAELQRAVLGVCQQVCVLRTCRCSRWTWQCIGCWYSCLLQLQLQRLARQSRATRKGARGSWGNRNKTITRQNTIKKFGCSRTVSGTVCTHACMCRMSQGSSTEGVQAGVSTTGHLQPCQPTLPPLPTQARSESDVKRLSTC
jgi:hypothetical protein